jgi:hypothetical protein
MLRALRILILFLFPVMVFSQIPKTDSQLSSQLQNLIPNNTQKLITPANVRTVVQDGWDARVSIYGETSILGKLTYNSLFPITNDGDLIYKAYLEERLAAITVDSTDTTGGEHVTHFNNRFGDVFLDSADVAPFAYPRYSNPSGFLTSINPATIRGMFSAGSGLTYNSGTGLFSFTGTTTNVPEGSNLYYTPARVKALFFGDNPIIFNSTTGHISFAGLSSLGTAGQQIRINSSGTGFEYFTPTVTNQLIQAIGDVIAPAHATILNTTIANNAITTPKINNGAVTVAKIYASGIPNALTYLRGDSTWSRISFNDLTDVPDSLTNGGGGIDSEVDPVYMAGGVKIANTYANPSWLTGLAWSKISGTPNSLLGYGISDPVLLSSGSYSNPSWLTSLAWAKITGKPTSLLGYGITDPVILSTGSYTNPSWLVSIPYSKITGAPAQGVLGLTGTANQIAISGTSSNPIIGIHSSYPGQTSISTLGTIGVGTWQGAPIANNYIASANTWNAKEPGLGNPAANGYVLSSTTAGVRSWIPVSSSVNTVFGRTGSIVAMANDYAAYYYSITNPLSFISRTGVSATGGYISYDNSTGVFSTPYIPERISNKSTSTALGASNDLYPSQNAVKVYVDNQIAIAANAGVQTFNTRSGNVSPLTGDYNTDQVTEGSINKYFTNARVWSALSAVSPLVHNGSGGFSLNGLVGFGGPGQVITTNGAGNGLIWSTPAPSAGVKVQAPFYFTLGTDTVYLENGNVALTEQGNPILVENPVAGNVLTMPKADSTRDGYISKEDWHFFYHKGEGTGTGNGTVLSFTANNLSPLFTTSVATPYTTPVLSFTLTAQAANRVWAGPVSGGSAVPTYRSLVANDIPALPYYPSTGNPSGFLTTVSFSQVTAKPTTILGYGITDPIVYSTGSYANPAWLTSLSYSKLTGTPTYATVATTGSYLDLTNKPTIPAQFNPIAGTNISITGTYPNLTFNSTSSGNVTSVFNRTGVVTAQTGDYTFAQIGAKPTTLSGYGITDAYPLTGNPSGFLTTVSYAQVTGKPTFAQVAFSGLYSDLSGVPTIPTTTSQLTNNSGFLTSETDPLYTANGVPKIRTLTINGVTQSLDANRSWTIETFDPSSDLNVALPLKYVSGASYMIDGNGKYLINTNGDTLVDGSGAAGATQLTVLPSSPTQAGSMSAADYVLLHSLGGGTGSVSSVGLSMPTSIFNASVTNSPVTGSGVLTPTLKTQLKNLVFASDPTSDNVVPTFRGLVAADIPSLPASKLSASGTQSSSTLLRGDNTWAARPGGNPGTVTSVSASVTASTAMAVNVTNATSTPAIALSWTGNSAQQILGDGSLATRITNTNQLTNGSGFITNATGLIASTGSNISVTGNGTLGSPFAINTSFTGATGWGTPTGTLRRSAFDASTITVENAFETLSALITDLKALGILKP